MNEHLVIRGETAPPADNNDFLIMTPSRDDSGNNVSRNPCRTRSEIMMNQTTVAWTVQLCLPLSPYNPSSI
jgi:hypothetical protein